MTCLSISTTPENDFKNIFKEKILSMVNEQFESLDLGMELTHENVVSQMGDAIQASIEEGEEACELGYNHSQMPALVMLPDGIFNKFDSFFEKFRKEVKLNGVSDYLILKRLFI